MKSSAMFVISALVVPSVLAAAPDATEIGRQEHAQWETAINHGNATDVATLYTEDAVVKPPFESAPLVLRPAIQNYWTSALKDGPKEYQVNIVAGRLQGDTVFLSGFWSAVPRAEGGALVGGHIIRVLEKQPGGTWKISLENWY